MKTAFSELIFSKLILRSFITGGTEIKSSKGTTQGDPVAMPIYALSVIPLMLMVLEITIQKRILTLKW